VIDDSVDYIWAIGSSHAVVYHGASNRGSGSFKFENPAAGAVPKSPVDNPLNPFTPIKAIQTESSDSYHTGHSIHAVIMFLAWGVFAPAGIITARYFKYYIHWIRIHLVLMAAAVVLSLITIIVLLSSSKGNYGSMGQIDAHKVIGFVLVALMLINVAFGFKTRRELASLNPSRMFTNILRGHKLIGVLLVIMTMINITLGIGFMISSLVPYFIVYMVVVGGVFLGLESLRRKPSSRKGSMAPSNDMSQKHAIQMLPMISIKEFNSSTRIKADKKTSAQKWVVFDDLVIDLDGYLNSHPGGRFILEASIGSEVTRFFRGQALYSKHVANHTHSKYALNILHSNAVGILGNSYNVFSLMGEANNQPFVDKVSSRWKVKNSQKIAKSTYAVTFENRHFSVLKSLKSVEDLGRYVDVTYEILGEEVTRSFSFVFGLHQFEQDHKVNQTPKTARSHRSQKKEAKKSKKKAGSSQTSRNPKRGDHDEESGMSDSDLESESTFLSNLDTKSKHRPTSLMLGAENHKLTPKNAQDVGSNEVYLDFDISSPKKVKQKETPPQESQSETSHSFNLYIKNYGSNQNLSTYITSNSFKGRVRISPLKGRGLGLSLSSTGTHIALTAGTGILPFLDLIYLLMNREINTTTQKQHSINDVTSVSGKSSSACESLDQSSLSLLTEERGRITASSVDKSFMAGFKLVVIHSEKEKESMVGLKLIKKCQKVCKRSGRFKVLFKFTDGGERVDRGFLEQNLPKEDVGKVWLCGTAGFQSDMASHLKSLDYDFSKIQHL